MSSEPLTVGARYHVVDPRRGYYQGNIAEIDEADNAVRVVFDDKYECDDEWYGFEAARKAVTKAKAAKKAEIAAAARETKQQTTPSKDQAAAKVTRATWTRASQTDEDELTIAATFDGRDRFEQELKRIVEERIEASLRTLKTDIVGNVIQAYGDALWASPLTHRHHLRMGFNSDPHISGRARRWQGAAQETGGNGSKKAKKARRKQ
jgi:hypothetical protein